jgi:hypothetical protein
MEPHLCPDQQSPESQMAEILIEVIYIPLGEAGRNIGGGVLCETIGLSGLVYMYHYYQKALETLDLQCKPWERISPV